MPEFDSSLKHLPSRDIIFIFIDFYLHPYFSGSECNPYKIEVGGSSPSGCTICLCSSEVERVAVNH